MFTFDYSAPGFYAAVNPTNSDIIIVPAQIHGISKQGYSLNVHHLDDHTESVLVSRVKHPPYFSNPSWSPNGDKILYTRGPLHNLGAVEWIDVATGEVFPITLDGRHPYTGGTHDAGMHRTDTYYYPLWSPNGNHIVYQYHTRLGDAELYVYDVITGESRIIARDLFIDTRFISPVPSWDGLDWGTYPYSNMSWTPDGKHLTFIADVGPQVIVRIDVMTGDRYWVYRPDMPYSYSDIRSPVWSPNGEQLAYLEIRREFGEDYTLFDIMVIEATTLELTAFNIRKVWDDIIWSPNSEQIAYVNSEMNVVRLDVASGEEVIIFDGAEDSRTQVLGWHNVCLDDVQNE